MNEPIDILLIENDPGVASAVRRLLEMEGYCVTIAVAFEEARDVLGSGLVPRVILTDMVDEEAAAAEFIDELRRDPESAWIPVVLFSGRKEAPEIARRLGAFDLVSKPAEIDHLLAVVQRAVTLQRPSK